MAETRMRVLFTSSPLAGHINPLWRYAEGLRGAGHDVRFATTEETRAGVERRGFELMRIADPTPEERARGWALLDACTAEEAPEIAFREIFGGINARAALPGLRGAIETWKPDMVVRESTEIAGMIAAEEAGLPSAMVSILANGAMQRHAGCFLETADLLRDYAGFSGRSGQAETVFSDFPSSLDDGGLILGAEPIRVAPSAPAKAPLTGDESWLSQGGEPFVYVTFGTVSGRSDKAKAAYVLALEVMADLPVRGLLTTGPIMDPALLGTIPANVVVETFVPQTTVFSRADTVVHHGGSGTFLGAMAAGLPQVVVPLFADQPHNASAIHATGAGLAVFDREADVLRAAILRSLEEQEMRLKAEELASEMAGMTPMSHAVEVMEGLLR
jgi:UDP:flavonoid glycosyltransferase YjiC (YdhE family)